MSERQRQGWALNGATNRSERTEPKISQADTLSRISRASERVRAGSNAWLKATWLIWFEPDNYEPAMMAWLIDLCVGEPLKLGDTEPPCANRQSNHRFSAGFSPRHCILKPCGSGMPKSARKLADYSHFKRLWRHGFRYGVISAWF